MVYDEKLPEKMLSYFSYTGEKGLPSFAKFAACTGYTLSALESFRGEHEDFASAYDECRARLFDMIAEGALTKKYDGSFAKFLLSGGLDFRASCEDNEESEEFKVKITVIEQGNGN